MTFDKMTMVIAFAQDAQERLTSVTSVPPPSASVSQTAAIRAEFFYDARNRCILRKYYTRGSQGQWVLNTTDSRALTYDNVWNLLTERTLDGKQVGEYIHGIRTDEILRAELITQTQNPKSQTLYPLADSLGTTVALTDDQGRLTQRYRYTAYGTPTALRSDYTLPATGSSLLNYRFLFTGRELLGSLGLNDHRNRYYSLETGRWLAPDPIHHSGGWNLYSYVGNRVILLVDRFGLCCESESKEVAALERELASANEESRLLLQQINDLANQINTNFLSLTEKAISVWGSAIIASLTGGNVMGFITGGTAPENTRDLLNAAGSVAGFGVSTGSMVSDANAVANLNDIIQADWYTMQNDYNRLAELQQQNPDLQSKISDAQFALTLCQIRNVIPPKPGCPCN